MFHCFLEISAVRYKQDVVSAYQFMLLSLSFSDMLNFAATENDEIDPDSVDDGRADGPTCKFGSLTLKRGEKLKIEHHKDYKVLCRCDVPPFVTCSRTPTNE